MRTIKHLVFGLTLSLLIVLAAVAFLPLVKDTWLRLSGAVITNGTSTHSYTDMPVRILSAKGQRWTSWNKLEDASAYHALVLLPPATLSDSGSISSGDRFTHTNIRRWLVQKSQPDDCRTDEKELEIVYNAVSQTIAVDSRTYYLANGNLFVIRFDKSWQPKVTQLNATIDQDVEIIKLIDTFKYMLREDEAVQKLQ